MFRTNARTLLAGLKPLASLTGKTRMNIPILTQVRVKAAGKWLTLSATDLDMQLDIDVEAEVSAPAQTCLHARQLARILGQLPGLEPIELTLDNGAALLSWASGRVRLFTMPHQDFPQMTHPQITASARVSAASRESLVRASTFMSNEETRYYLNGVCLDLSEEGAKWVATDGHRMGVLLADLEFDRAIRENLILPKAAVNLWKSSFGPEAVELAILGRNTFSVTSMSGLRRLTSKMIDGTYPEWRRVVPKDALAVVENADKGRLLQAARVISAIVSKGHKEVLLSGDGGRLVMRHRAMESCEVVVDCGSPAPEGFSLALNVTYLRSACEAARGRTVSLHKVPGEFEPTLIAGADDRSGEAFIVMPLRAPRDGYKLEAPVVE